MKRGKLPGPPAEKRQRGTYRPSRHAALLQPADNPDLPQAPDWLTDRGRILWLDLVPRIQRAGKGCELDSFMLATLANLLAACADAWNSGAVPPASHLSEARRSQELFGLAGTSSRVLVAGIPPTPGRDNPFASNGRRPGDGT